MQDNQDKALSTFVRSMKRALKQDHNLEVGYTALRASYLQASGENPHAFSKASTVVQAASIGNAERLAPVPETPEVSKLKAELQALRQLIAKAPVFFHPSYDFDGAKLQWLIDAGLAEDTAKVAVPPVNLVRKKLYLVGDDLGVLSKLALDADGKYLLPKKCEVWRAELVSQRACLPRVSKYGLPDYFAKSAEFFFKHFGLIQCADYEGKYIDLGDDSGDTCTLEIAIESSEWSELVKAVTASSPAFKAAVAEWVGLHYSKNFASEAKAKQVDWAERYLEIQAEATQPVRVTFEWVYPDDDGGSVPALIDLGTGKITLQGPVPEDIYSNVVDHRIWVCAEEDEAGNLVYPECFDGEMFPVEYISGSKTVGLFVSEEYLSEIESLLP